MPSPIAASDFDHALDKAYIRAPQTWLDDPAFDVKWTSILGAPIDLLGGANSAFHKDLASRATPLPGGEVICHGDAKFDNFGWTRAGGPGLFSDNDFDDSGYCPAAADILHYLVATELEFTDSTLDDAVLSAYVDTLTTPSNGVAVDPTSVPVWDTVRSKGLAKDTSGGTITLGGEVQTATTAEIAAVKALIAADPRLPQTVHDITRDVRIDGGSAGFRRFWILGEDATHPLSIVELKESGPPGTEFGTHSATIDGDDRFDVLKPYWWGVPSAADHFGVALLGGRFLARDRLARVNPKPAKMTAAQIKNMAQAEASLLALKHASAWNGIDPAMLKAWLATSAMTLSTRWRNAYIASGGM